MRYICIIMLLLFPLSGCVGRTSLQIPGQTSPPAMSPTPDVSVVPEEAAGNAAEGIAENPAAPPPPRHKIERDNLYGYIDDSGAEIIPPIYKKAARFSEGFAAVAGEDDKWGFIDTDGNMKIEPQFNYANPFVDGRSLVSRDDKFGYVDTEGVMVIEAQYEMAVGFSNGYAVVSKRNESGDIYDSVIDSDGNTVASPMENAVITSYYDGACVVRTAPVGQDNSEYVLLSTDGSRIIDTAFELITSFSEGLVAARLDGLYGFYDVAGNKVIDHKYTSVNIFSEGMAQVVENENVFYIDKAGEVKVMFNGNVAGNFHDGMAWYKSETTDTFGYMDQQGIAIIRPKYLSATDFNDGVAIVTTAEEEQHINIKGEVIWKRSIQ